MGFDGRIEMTIPAPPITIYSVHEAAFRPTAVSVVDDQFGGQGEIWVADGYGTGLVHQFGQDGSYKMTISGEEGRAGAFRNPHALLIVQAKEGPELLVADRHNSRLQIYDLQGKYKSSIVDDHIVTPSALAEHGGRIYVAELQGGIVVLDESRKYVGTIFPRESKRQIGWPNEVVDGRLQRPALTRGRFNSPHGLAVLEDGSIVVAEWVLGGRITRLAPAEE